ncbi:MAG: carboxypeptidase-like regulatory domain-containing protein [Aequorivita sp.]|nr:carboxypeptidase-like regulatory domain-containing protein [Aequorivita sp.]
MAKKLLLLLFIISSSSIFAQDIERIKVAGKISVPTGDDAEGINVYNISSQKGTITNADGTFEIEITENDRVQVTALQYQSFTVVVDKGIVEQKRMNIFMNPSINQLDEVVVRPYDLSGNINVDVKKIYTYTVNKDLGLSDYNLRYGSDLNPDDKTKISGNAAEEALHGNTLTNGANILGILAGAVSLLLPKKDKTIPDERLETGNALNNNLQQRFSRNFIASTFDIPKEKAVDFLYFAQENGMDKRLLKPENEMELMEFLLEQSKEYKNRGEN